MANTLAYLCEGGLLNIANKPDFSSTTNCAHFVALIVTILVTTHVAAKFKLLFDKSASGVSITKDTTLFGQNSYKLLHKKSIGQKSLCQITI